MSAGNSENIIYESESVKQKYDKRYSGFTFLPAFENEKRRIRKVFSNIFKKYQINPSRLNSFLDLGCGFGIKTYILSDFFQKSKGTDFSPNAIQIASLLNDKPGLQFEVMDFHKPNSTEKYDFVTALGLSVLNISDTEKYSDEIIFLWRNYLKNNGYLVVHSFTDFSGKAPSGWYNHTSAELKLIDKKLTANKLSIQNYFPHKYLHNYFGRGLENFLAELYKLVFTKKRDYYFIIHEDK